TAGQIPEEGLRLLGAAGGLLLLAAGCGGGGRGTFILLPDPDGSVGKITVTSAGNRQVVDQAWHGVEVQRGAAAPSAPVPVPQEQVEREFEAVLRTAPVAPAHYLLQFQMDSTELTAGSRALLPEIVAETASRQSVNTSVVGHADTSGGKEYNYALSLQRARAVADLLIERGVAEEILEITSHGEENLRIPTADEVNEPRNRRVEITVR
ncbi:MAG: OmpA family protein, partial [Deferrisomatales bacterium]|nr:OmpA family protein [Deferrisomatales bacterium]